VNLRVFFTAVLLFLSSQLLEYAAITLSHSSFANLCAWDCSWYAGIVRDGYDLKPHAHPKGDAANWAFFPAFPLFASALGYVTALSPEVSSVVAGKLFFFASILVFIKFAQAYNPRLPVGLAGAVVAFNPYVIYGNTGYTEPMFLFFSCAAFFCLKRERYVAAGAFGGLLTSIRLVGIFFLLSYLVAAIRKFFVSDMQRRDDIALGALLIPLGLSLFMVFLYFHMGDALAFLHIQRAWNRIPQSPLFHLAEGFNHGKLFLLWTAMTLGTLLLSVVLGFKKRLDLAVFTFFCTVIPLSTGLWSMPRYIWWQAPLLLALAEILSWKRLWILILPLFIGWSVFMYVSWFQLKWFVV
jgi:Gpi18-like mannosyltransferase